MRMCCVPECDTAHFLCKNFFGYLFQLITSFITFVHSILTIFKVLNLNHIKLELTNVENVLFRALYLEYLS